MVGKDRLRQVLPDHLAYQASLEEAGHLAFAGPLSDDSGDNWSGAGLIIYHAADIDTARALAAGAAGGRIDLIV